MLDGQTCGQSAHAFRTYRQAVVSQSIPHSDVTLSSRALGGPERFGKLMAGVETVDWLPSLDSVERRTNKAPSLLLTAVRRTLQEKVRYHWRRTLHPIPKF